MRRRRSGLPRQLSLLILPFAFAVCSRRDPESILKYSAEVSLIDKTRCRRHVLDSDAAFSQKPGGVFQADFLKVGVYGPLEAPLEQAVQMRRSIVGKIAQIFQGDRPEIVAVNEVFCLQNHVAVVVGGVEASVFQRIIDAFQKKSVKFRNIHNIAL